MAGQTDEKEVRTALAVEAATFRSASLWCSPWLHALLLLLLVAATFGRTLGNYFLADDFCEIAYVNRIFDGEPGLFWSNFTGNYMQIPGMNVYRPWMLCSLVNDWLLFHAQAWGYYLTNLIYYAAVSLLLYAVVRQLTGEWGSARSSLTAVLSACFFVANPLHAESVSWVVGRVDIIAACFYLLSFNCCIAGMKKRSRAFQSFAVIAFILALGTKEMAVGLPALVACVAFFWGNVKSHQLRVAGADSNSSLDRPSDLLSTLVPRFKFAVVFSLPFWLTLAGYFVVRFLCLKTLVGGYVGGFGASQISEMFHHWADLDTIRRLLIPLNNQLYGNNPAYGTLIGATQLIIATVLFVRVLAGNASWRWFIFLAIWCATAAVPIFQLWGIGFNLEGARFYFFLSMPLSLIIPVLLFHPANANAALSAESDSASITNTVSTSLTSREPGAKSTQPRMNIEKALYLTGTLGSLALLVLLQKACVQTNMLWVHAGKEVKRLSDACQTLVSAHPGQTKFVVLGIPKDNAGAHMILNGTTFDVMLRPPFTKTDYASRLLNCDAVMYSPEQYINGAQLRWMLSRKDVNGPYVWSSEKQRLLKFNYNAPAHFIPILSARTESAGDGLDLKLDKINPLDYQVLQFDLKSQSARPTSGSIVWSGLTEDSSCPYSVVAAAAASELRTVTVDLGHYWRWYALGRITRLHIALPPSACTISNVRLLPATDCAPSLMITKTTAANADPPPRSGAGPEDENPYAASISTSPISLQLESAALPGAQSVAVEIGRQDYFFDNFLTDEKVNATAKTNVYPLQTSRLSLATKVGTDLFPNAGFYQLRAHYLNAEGKRVGVNSDPVTLKLSR